VRAPVSWLRELVDIPSSEGGRDIAERLVRAGLEVETVEVIGEGVVGTLVIGHVVEIEELAEFKKPIRWCQVDVGPDHGGVRGIICGARNFAAGDIVVVALPGTVLPGGFMIAARETYGHTSDGMICSERELGLGDNHDGIMVLPADAGVIGADAAPIVGVGDEVLDIAVTPDRGYALSIRGIARELAFSYDVEFDDPGVRVVALPAPASGAVPADCGSEDFGACELFTMRTVTGFDPSAPSPLWMQRRLVSCGMRPVSLAVDVTNYVMLELGQPLHAFDLDKLSGPVRAGWAPAGSRLETLDHVVRDLGPEDLVIMDDSGIIGLAGTMGGLTSEIDDGTVNIALEAAHFSSGVVARVSRRHRLSTEASRRFERGVDRVLAPYASARAAELLMRFGGGTYVGMTAVEAEYRPSRISMPASEPADVAGMPIDSATVVRLLQSVGCEVAGSDGTLTVDAPSWRPDLTDPADLVEEVVRLVGYDTLPSTLPTSALGHGLTQAQRVRRRVGMALAARGAIEVLTYPFVGDRDLDSLRIAADDPCRARVRLANPLSDEQPMLRASLLPGLVAAARRNIGRGNFDLNIFELGSVFRGLAGETLVRPSVEHRPTDAEWSALNALLPEQPIMVGCVLAGERIPAGWWGPSRAHDWSDAVESAQVIAEVLGVELTIARGSDPTFHPGRCAALMIGEAQVGVAGELHPRVIEATELPARACAMELSLDACREAATAVRRAPEVSTHPVAKEDLALVVADDVPASAVLDSLREGAGDLLESIRLFDVYRGSQVAEGHRSLAFALKFRAADRTLDAGEILLARQAAIDSAARTCGATLR
jgi:phenylalanyl-tRNA synthetase beta chain